MHSLAARSPATTVNPYACQFRLFLLHHPRYYTLNANILMSVYGTSNKDMILARRVKIMVIGGVNRADNTIKGIKYICYVADHDIT